MKIFDHFSKLGLWIRILHNSIFNSIKLLKYHIFESKYIFYVFNQNFSIKTTTIKKNQPLNRDSRPPFHIRTPPTMTIPARNVKDASRRRVVAMKIRKNNAEKERARAKFRSDERKHESFSLGALFQRAKCVMRQHGQILCTHCSHS